MKTAGIILLVVGLAMTLYTGVTYVAEEKVVDLGNLEITGDDHHSVHWQPYVGIGTMVIGGAALLLHTFGRDSRQPVVDGLRSYDLLFAAGRRPGRSVQDDIRHGESWSGVQRRAIIVGTGEAAKDVAVNVSMNGQLGIDVVGFLDDELPIGHPMFSGAEVVGRLADV